MDKRTINLRKTEFDNGALTLRLEPIAGDKIELTLKSDKLGLDAKLVSHGNNGE